MGINLFRFVLIQRYKSVQNVVARSSVIGSTFSNIRFLMPSAVRPILVELAFIVREIILHGGDGEFFLESIDLVEEKNDRSLDEPPGVANRVEESQSLLHPIDGLIFEEELIIF